MEGTPWSVTLEGTFWMGPHGGDRLEETPWRGTSGWDAPYWNHCRGTRGWDTLEGTSLMGKSIGTPRREGTPGGAPCVGHPVGDTLEGNHWKGPSGGNPHGQDPLDWTLKGIPWRGRPGGTQGTDRRRRPHGRDTYMGLHRWYLLQRTPLVDHLAGIPC
jgi:hypothetical protein